MKVRSALLALAATGLLLVAGCGGDSSDGGSGSTTEATTAGDGGTTDSGAPSEAELSQGVQKGLNVPAAQADCMARELSGADLSEASLQAIAEANQDGLSTEDSEAAIAAVKDALAAC